MEQFKEIPLEQLRKSPTNPRRRRDPKKFEDLVASVKEKGIIQPIVVRANLNGAFASQPYEIVVGEGRYLAAKKVELPGVPAMVRELSDLDVVEIQLIENKHREDMNCLDEAEGYQRLSKDGGYSIQRIAERIGLSEKYVYDRIKLLQLITEAKNLVLSERITAGHAILLARLHPDDQKRAIDGGLFEHEHLLFNPHATDDELEKLPKEELKYMEKKARSVRELQGWIDEHVRFDRKAPDPMLFPETSATVTAAAETKEKVIQITHDHYIQPDAKEGNAERIYTERSWKLADGSSKKAKTCEKSVTGVVVVGPERGAAHKVCVHKECPVHWAKEKRERLKMQSRSTEAQRRRDEADRERARLEREREEAKREAWKKAKPAVTQACLEKVQTARFGALAPIVYGDRNWQSKDVLKLFKPKSLEDLGRFAALRELLYVAESWDAYQRFPKLAKQIGVDVQKMLQPPRSAKANGKVAGAIHPNSEAAKIAHAVESGDGRDTRSRSTRTAPPR
jgi:ParB family transcriptional regulator, chromosome partitioning protein